MLRQFRVEVASVGGHDCIIGLDVGGCSVVLVASLNEPGEDDERVALLGVGEEGWSVREEFEDCPLNAGLSSGGVIGGAGHR